MAQAGTLDQGTSGQVRVRPPLTFWQIWNMCFGFLGIQFGFALQNANTSRIFQTLGADMSTLPILWVAAPATGLLVQPIIGYLSDRTWGPLGRRRPYFLVGAVIASAALIAMPNSPTLWVAAGMLWIMDASINITMEPFRAFVGDNLPEKQRTTGFAMQSFFIGIGAVVASMLPWMAANWFGVSNSAPEGQVPDTVKLSFYWGGAVFLIAVLWTVFRSSEYSPEELAAFESHRQDARPADEPSRRSASQYTAWGGACVAVGVAFFWWVSSAGLDQQLYILAAGIAGFGLLQLATATLQRGGKTDNPVYQITEDLFAMPRVMKQLAVVQFFSWFALFAMWIYGTGAVTSFHYGTTDTTSELYNEGANWVGILFAVYNGFAAIAAVGIPALANRIGCRACHAIAVTIGGVSLASFFVIRDPTLLLLPMVGVGIAWASILSMPYALLAGALPAGKMGIYMGIFNFFIVIPQLIAASVLGLILREVFNNQAIFGFVIGGVLMTISAVAVLMVDASAEPYG